MPEPFNLREAVLYRGEEVSEQDDQKACAQRTTRLDQVAAFMGKVASPDLLDRLDTPQSMVFGEPCKPFQPPIHLAAAQAIQELEQGGDTLSNEEFMDLTSRLIGFYGIGPEWGIRMGKPEFGYNLMDTSPLKLEAAARVLALAPDLAVTLGVIANEQVAAADSAVRHV